MNRNSSNHVNSGVRDYRTLGTNYFIGYTKNSSGGVQDMYACGIEKGKVFCLKRDISTSSNVNYINTNSLNQNQNILSSIFSGGYCHSYNNDGDYGYLCAGNDVYARADNGWPSASVWLAGYENHGCGGSNDGISIYCY